jgi:hypothetical protein
MTLVREKRTTPGRHNIPGHSACHHPSEEEKKKLSPSPMPLTVTPERASSLTRHLIRNVHLLERTYSHLSLPQPTLKTAGEHL